MIIEKATGKDLERFAQTELFSKLGIRETHWWRDSSKIPVGGRNLAYCCLDATPRDYAKLGQLIVNNGIWNGQQIVPKSYIDEIKKSVKLVENSGSYKQVMVYNSGQHLIRRMLIQLFFMQVA
jgi:CubicO group peptidase (beta-lactamase class C family)